MVVHLLGTYLDGRISKFGLPSQKLQNNSNSEAWVYLDLDPF